MFNSKELFSILVLTLIFAFAIGLFRSIERLPYIFLVFLIIILVNVLAKKIASFYLDSEMEIKLWTIERYGFKPSRYLKKPFPAGIILPILTSLLFWGQLSGFIWLASLVFDVKPKVYRAAKRYGLYSYTEMTEDHIGIIAATGVFANLFFAVIGYLLGFPEFARFSIYFAFFNMIPLSDLDGNKIFFGNLVLWSFLAALVLIGLAYAFFLV